MVLNPNWQLSGLTNTGVGETVKWTVTSWYRLLSLVKVTISLFLSSASALTLTFIMSMAREERRGNFFSNGSVCLTSGNRIPEMQKNISYAVKFRSKRFHETLKSFSHRLKFPQIEMTNKLIISLRLRGGFLPAGSLRAKVSCIMIISLSNSKQCCF